MKILIINTQNKLVAKDMLVRTAIKAGMQYVEMENEILIEDCLFRIEEKESTMMSNALFLFEKKETEYIPVGPTLEVKTGIPRQKRLDYKKQSKFANEKLKMNQNYNNRRRYR